MDPRRKKDKKLHYRNPKVSADSVAGKIRARNQATQDQLDQLD
jgi:hypothetical protein